MGKKFFSAIGMLCGVAVIILGFLVFKGNFSGSSSTASSTSYSRGYATFGADFYTYVSNNAAEAASAARTTANNLRGIAVTLENVMGIFLMAFGAFMFCLFGTKLTDSPRVKVASAAPDPAQLPVSAETPHPVVESIKEKCLGADGLDAVANPADHTPVPAAVPEIE